MVPETVDIAQFSEESVDRGVLAEIPLFQDEDIKEIEALSASAWAQSYKITVKGEDEEEGKEGDHRNIKVYFMKVSLGEHGREALKGEYQSTHAIHKVQKDFIPKPVAHGSFKTLQNAHYYVCKFYELTEELPEAPDFCAKVAALHEKSRSPNGKFGFHVVTYNGNLPQENGYTDTWESFFTNGFKHMIKLNVQRGGRWEEEERLHDAMVSKVIPRLLRPLESNGRSIKPCLVHGDLWCGNAATISNSDLPLVFDPSSFYAHNEYELGNWRPKRNKFSKAYFDSYHTHIPKAKPEKDYDDRNALYSIRYNLHAAAMFPDMKEFRQMVIEEMERLVAKYPAGFERTIMKEAVGL